MAADHPFAAGGGGGLFENRIGCLLAAELLAARVSRVGGLVTAIHAQTGPAGFDDLHISIERTDGTEATVHAQCRHRQELTSSNDKFATLLGQGFDAVSNDRVAFASGRRRLALVVSAGSPGAQSLVDLCRLAAELPTAGLFQAAVERHRGRVAARLRHCQTASQLGADDLHSLLGALDLITVEVDDETSRDSLEMINQLAALWPTPNRSAATDLANALFKLIAERTTRAGVFDLGTLQSALKAKLSGGIGAGTRRARLERLRNAGSERVAESGRLLGLDYALAEQVAESALAVPALTLTADVAVIVGAIGIGKTTELERQHRQAIDAALTEPSAPIPLFVHARELAVATKQAIVQSGSAGLGDPSKVGVHLVVDGLDEVGLSVESAITQLAGARAIWPNTRVVLATRPQQLPRGVKATHLAPLGSQEAEELMTAIHPNSTSWLPRREELTEVLRRPLFAITYAMDHKTGNVMGTRPANLVASVGRRATKDLDPSDKDSFNLLVELASQIVDSGGATVELSQLGANPLDVERVARTRIVQIVDGRAMFQLAALTEWFAATGLLTDPSRLEAAVRSPLAVHGWRYALVQAIRQGTVEQANRMMVRLLDKTPAIAAWVYHEAVEPFGSGRTVPLADSVVAAGELIRDAATHWIGPWPAVLQAMYLRNGQMPMLGIAVNDVASPTVRMVTAWGTRPLHGDPVVDLPPAVHPLGDRQPLWTGEKSGGPVDGPLWPWNWIHNQFDRVINDLVRGRDLLAEIDSCWDELAWDFAYRMLDKSPDVQSAPVPLAALEETVAQLEASVAGVPDLGEVFVSNGKWTLSEGQAFIADLHRLGITQISSPWPAADTRGGWTWLWWTHDQLVRRLNATSKAALDVYRELVDRIVPSMAAELPTYQLLPARLTGEVTKADPGGGLEGAPRFTWWLEPVETGTQNDSIWTTVEASRSIIDPRWGERAATVRRLRGEVAARRLTIHNGEPEVFSPMPAGSLALRLLIDDLSDMKWCQSGRYDGNAGPARPRGR